MRPVNLAGLTRVASAAAPTSGVHPNVISFQGSRGELFRIVALEESSIRVQLWPNG